MNVTEAFDQNGYRVLWHSIRTDWQYRYWGAQSGLLDGTVVSNSHESVPLHSGVLIKIDRFDSLIVLQYACRSIMTV